MTPKAGVPLTRLGAFVLSIQATARAPSFVKRTQTRILSKNGALNITRWPGSLIISPGAAMMRFTRCLFYDVFSRENFYFFRCVVVLEDPRADYTVLSTYEETTKTGGREQEKPTVL
uniref:Secreted protein n=1 Tax=Romanomermis culicivorax TaxID=13658 RepID=A0A915IBB8_ROMCU